MSEIDLELSPRAASERLDVQGDRTRQAFRMLMREIAQPVAVLTGCDRIGRPMGMTVTSFTSLSMDPPMIVVCPASGSRTWSRIHPTGRFILNLLSSDQHDIADAFAQPGSSFPADVAHRFTIDGMPLLAHTVAAVRCASATVVAGGDHDVVLARVVRVRLDGGPVLAYQQGDYVAPDRVAVH